MMIALESSAFSLILPEPGLVFWSLLIFIILWALLAKFAFKPIAKAIKNREQSIDEALQSAEKAREEMENLQAENEEIIRQAKEERQQILAEARQVKDQIVDEARTEASAKADKILENARQEMEAQRAAMMDDLKKSTVALALEISERVLRKQLDDKPAQEAMAKEMVDNAKLN